MKLSHGLGLLVAGLGTTGLLLAAGASGLVGCSSSNTSGGDGGPASSGNDLCTSAGVQCTVAPPVPSASKTTSTTPHNYALHQLFLGDTDRSGNPSTDAWKTFGYNLDDKVTTAASTDVCALVAGASKQYQADGNGGIDNSFGANIMPIIQTLDSSASQTLNQSIQTGSFTIMTYVTGFDDSAGNMTSATGLTGVLLAGAKFSTDGGAPGWDLQTNWPVLYDPGLISGCSMSTGCPAGYDPVANAVIKFTSAFQSKGTFVNGTPSPLALSLSIGGQSLTLNIAAASIAFDPLMPGAVTNGTIAGVLDTMELINGLKSVAGNISTSLCSGSAFDSIALQIQQTSDIMLNGSTVSNSAGPTCNAISIGLGFNSTEIAAPTVIAPPSAAAKDPCADGG
jgi:hypothetical protein